MGQGAAFSLLLLLSLPEKQQLREENQRETEVENDSSRLGCFVGSIFPQGHSLSSH